MERTIKEKKEKKDKKEKKEMKAKKEMKQQDHLKSKQQRNTTMTLTSKPSMRSCALKKIWKAMMLQASPGKLEMATSTSSFTGSQMALK